MTPLTSTTGSRAQLPRGLVSLYLPVTAGAGLPPERIGVLIGYRPVLRRSGEVVAWSAKTFVFAS